MHVTLRSSKAFGKFSLLRFETEIIRILERQANRWKVLIYERAVNGNHIHLAIRGKERRCIQNFFRSICGLIARLVTGAERGRKFGKFWDELIWSRIAEWGKAFHSLKAYVRQNYLEAHGLIPYQPRRRSNRAPGARAGPV